MSENLIVCNGTINQAGYCNKCFAVAHTTSGQCTRVYVKDPFSPSLETSQENEGTFMNDELRQKLFSYFHQEHDIEIMDSDFNEIEYMVKRHINSENSTLSLYKQKCELQENVIRAAAQYKISKSVVIKINLTKATEALNTFNEQHKEIK